jgi:hypothetical protein
VPDATLGYTASATPAASVTGSEPATRVVLRVAVPGNPRLLAVSGGRPSVVDELVLELLSDAGAAALEWVLA